MQKLEAIPGLMDLKMNSLGMLLLQEVLIIVPPDYRPSHLIRKKSDCKTNHFNFLLYK